MLHGRSYFFLFLVPVLALSACGGEKPIDEPTGAVQEAIPSGGVHLAGTYTSDSQQAGMFSQLVLKTDGTYHAMLNNACTPPRCVSLEQNGRYLLFRRETIAYAQFYDAGGSMIGRYEYALRGDTLSLRKFATQARWTPMVRSPAAWCATNQDCALQDLQIGPCAGQYICTTTSTCNWHCGAEPEIAGKSPKTGAGG